MTSLSRNPFLSGRFELLQTYVREGSRRVYCATDRLLHRPVVVKGVRAMPGTDAANALLEEYRRLALHPHPAIAKAYDLGWAELIPGEDSSTPFFFFTQEWISGPSLHELAGKLTPDEIRECMMVLLEAVAFLHYHHLVCLDLKSDHLIRNGGGWRLIDLDQAQVDNPLKGVELMGTLPYLAPEVLLGEEVGASSDLYSLGALLFETLSGRPPHLEGESLEQLRRWLPSSPPPTLPDEPARLAPDLAALCEALLQRSPTQRPSSAEAVLRTLSGGSTNWKSIASLADSVFVGRESFMTRLEQRVEETIAQKGGYLEIVGEVRSGKSRALFELATRLSASGRPVLRLDKRALEATPQGLIPLLMGHLRTLTGVEYRSASPAAPLSGSSLSEARESALRSALSELTTLGEAFLEQTTAPLTLLLDDLDKLDEFSFDVLERLRHHLSGRGLVFVGALRKAGRSPGHDLELSPLEPPEERVLAETLLGAGAVTAEDITTLHDLSRGRPGEVRRLLEQRWQNPQFTFVGYSSESERRPLEVQYPSLSEAARKMASAAAIFSGPFSLALLLSVCAPSTEREPSAILAELLRAGVLEQVAGSQEGLFRFARDGVRFYLEARLNQGERQALNRLAAERLEEEGFETTAESELTIARHHLAGGRPERARAPLRRAYSLAKARLWMTGAAEALKRLISLSSLEAQDWMELHVRQGELSLEAGRFAEARRHFDAGMKARVRPKGVEAQCQAGLGRALSALGELEPARLALEAALDLGKELSPRERLTWWYALAWIHLCTHHTPQAKQALKGARKEGLEVRSRLAIQHLRYEAWLSLEEGQITEEVITQLEAGQTLATQLNDVRGALDLLNLLMQVRQARGELEQAAQHALEMVKVAHENFELPWEATASVNLGYLLRASGDLAGAYVRFERAGEIQRRIGNGPAEARSLMASVEVLLAHAQWHRAATVLERVSTLVQQDAGSASHHWLELLRCRLDLGQKRLEGMDQRLTVLLERLPGLAQPELRLGVLSASMEYQRLMGKPDAVLKTYRQIPEELHQMKYLPSWRQIHALALEAHGQLGDPSTLAPREGEKRAADVAEAAVKVLRRSALIEGALKEGALREGALGEGPKPVEAHLKWFEQVKRLLERSDDVQLLAFELARQAGEMLSGRGLVLIFEGSRPQVAGGTGLTDEQVEDVSRSILERVRQERKTFACEDILADQAVRQVRSLRAAGVRSVLCAPILRDGVVQGVIYVDRQGRSDVSLTHGARLLEQVAQVAGSLLAGVGPRPIPTSTDGDDLGIVGESPIMRRLRTRLRELSESAEPDLVVLLTGPTGTGKSAIARRIHQAGTRRDGPFQTVDCAAIPEGLVEELMFGHLGGIFTGAKHARPGWFEQAENGTLFLDEVGEMPIEQQRRLLTTLGSRRFSRMGETTERELKVHLICATNRDLQAEVAAGRFRADLLRRIHVNVLTVPSLKERGASDIWLLATHFITEYLKRHERLPASSPRVDLREYMSPQAMEFLARYEWPWNVAELENLFRNESIRRQLRLSEGGRARRLTLEQVSEALCYRESSLEAPAGLAEVSALPPLLEEDLARTEAPAGDAAVKKLEPQRERAAAEPQVGGSREDKRAQPSEVEPSISDEAPRSGELGERDLSRLRLPPDWSYQALHELTESIKRSHVQRVFEVHGRKLLPTAESLGVSRDVVRRYLKGSEKEGE